MSVLGDTPASNFLGGFKEGVGFSLRKCRMCMATGDDISEKVIISSIIMCIYNTCTCIMWFLSLDFLSAVPC